jgi:drug/metabolite transporter (DMT)-like permease
MSAFGSKGRHVCVSSRPPRRSTGIGGACNARGRRLASPTNPSCAALCAGTSVAVTRFVVGEIDPVTVAFYRYAIAMICLLPALPFVWSKARVPTADVVTIALLGALFFGFFPWAFSAALQYTTAARGAIGIATIPIQTLIVAAISGREPLTRRNVLSVALGFAGIVTVFGPEAFRGEVSPHWLGDGCSAHSARRSIPSSGARYSAGIAQCLSWSLQSFSVC